ncbi:MAG: YifB family Mg chelatase-like AAA ATPase [Patescibacteria group bacterium]|nr:YifB family Mg chelatase-like AAA ATPase [Patescibacteria group bacterium]
MLAKIRSFVLSGVSCYEVVIETDVSSGLHKLNLVGLPDVMIREFKERVGAAIKNSGFSPPHHFGRITIFLAPSYLRKTGSGLDLAIAVSILEASGQLVGFKSDKAAYIGELSLDGGLKAVPGVLPMVIEARKAGYKKVFIPGDNYFEAKLVRGIEVICLDSLKEYGDFVQGKIKKREVVNRGWKIISGLEQNFCLDKIKGQERAKRALEIAAAGGHNLFLFGPPGAGKTVLARSLTEIMPELSFFEVMELTRIYSAAGLVSRVRPIIKKRPFRAPHHSITLPALIGGGARISPGEITLAHRGVLFLDEILEFSRKVLDGLRLPMEDGQISISRSRGPAMIFPARFLLAGAANPCACGYYGDSSKQCSCSSGDIARYRRKLSGPIMDRIDLWVEVSRVKFDKLQEKNDPSQGRIIKDRVNRAAKRQVERFGSKKEGVINNAEMDLGEIERNCQIDLKSREFLAKAVEAYNLSARAYYGLLKISRTIADLSGEEKIRKEHLAEAVQFRAKEF